MLVKNIIDEDFVNYKEPSMFIAMPNCNFKCCKEQNLPIEICQNCELAKQKNIEISVIEITHRFLDNPITEAIVFGGMEPFDSWNDIEAFVLNFRYRSDATIVLYTGYKEEEILEYLKWLSVYADDGPIIVKFGRYIPNQEPHYDEILGVYLASDNQYAKRLRYEDYH